MVDAYTIVIRATDPNDPDTDWEIEGDGDYLTDRPTLTDALAVAADFADEGDIAHVEIDQESLIAWAKQR